MQFSLSRAIAYTRKQEILHNVNLLSTIDHLMTDSTSESLTPQQSTDPNPSVAAESAAETIPSEPPPSYVKLAMRNMVRKGGKSLFHFFLTTAGLIGLFVGLAYLTR